ncbi:polymorphic toxin-type HINT domain-containing protein [Micromonospora sp. CPCC 206061]|uniref:polymorphic toxin-type HINT domain-containing protein n=1 Tax=Micromonospora sp. CPCC 206061 TaxID=3122410 RepID=UPI002FF0D904
MAAGLLNAGPASAEPSDRQYRPDGVKAEKSISVKAHTGSTRPAGTTDVVTAAPSVTWPAPATVETAPGTAATKAVRLAAARAARSTPAKVRVQVYDRATTAKAKVDGALMRLARADGSVAGAKVAVDLDYAGFRHAYGGDWASRLHLAVLPECALTTPRAAACAPKPLKTRNDARTGRLSAEVDLPGAPKGAFARSAASGSTLVAALAGPSGPNGSFAATTLSPSATWSAGGSSGDFSWSYPLRLPPAVGGTTPSLGLGYSSGSVDGRTASTNNQPSWVGEGFDLASGYIERRYKSCVDDIPGANNPKTGDQCWGTENATMSLFGSGSELIKDDATGVWRPKNDDGSRIELLPGAPNGDDNGEHWKVTTTNGAQFFFGLNRLPGWVSGQPETKSTWTVPVYGNHAGEPCHKATFATSWCQQAYRWNLDYAVDPAGNVVTYYYDTQQNHYGRNLNEAASPYVRAGHLVRVEYGLRAGAAYAPAPARVLFTLADRCIPGTVCDPAVPARWPDVPWDKRCDGTTCADRTSPTFWTTKRLSRIATQTWNGSTHTDLDSWTLNHTFPNPGDSSSAALWLESIVHTGHAGGTLSMPEINFDPIGLSNRVDGIEGLDPLYRQRIAAIHNETGAGIAVTYSARDCERDGPMPASPDTNTRRCQPVRWASEGVPEMLDWFHKYVVTQVTQRDYVTGAPDAVTSYEYMGDPAWHYDDEDGLVNAEQKSWGQWRGYSRVRTRAGWAPDNRVLSETLYFRGMDDDKLAGGARRDVWVTDSQGGRVEDHDRLAGVVRETIGYASDGGEALSRTINEPWMSAPTATRVRPWGTHHATMLDTGAVNTYAQVSGGWRRQRVEKAFDRHGIVTRVNDLGDMSTADDDQCSTFQYARDEGRWVLNLASEVKTVAKACGAPVTLPDDLLSQARTYYDGSPTLGAVPGPGNPTKVEELAEHTATGARYATVSRVVHDEYGRATETYDADGNKTTIEFTPRTGGPLSKVVTTNPLGHVSIVEVNPSGQPTRTIDSNGQEAAFAYDPLGRQLKVWHPGRSTTSTPTAEYAYLVRNNAPTVVTTKAVNAKGLYTTSHAIYDGSLRLRQTQVPSPGGGRILADVFYNTRGEPWKRNGAYYNQFPPDTTLVAPTSDADVPGQTRSYFDGAGRLTAEVLYTFGQERRRTSTSYEGDRVHVTPPAGGTATTTISDAKSRTVELREYASGKPTGAYDATRYTYDKRGALASVTDPAGNTWRYEYDLRGRAVRVEDPDRGPSTAVYDDAGQLTSTTDSRGATLAFAYDALGRTTAVHEGSMTGTKRAEYKYDTVAKGELSWATRWEANNAYTTEVTGYTSDYQPTASKVTIPASEGALGKSYLFSYTYNPDGSPATVKMPAAGGLAEETITYGYNDLGLPTTLTGLSGYVESTVYTKFSEVEQLALSTGGPRLWQTYRYEDGTRRLTESVTQREASGQTQARVKYGYDAAGNITRIADVPEHATADVQCFAYDHLRRLKDAWTTTSTADTSCAAGPSSATVGGTQAYWHTYSYDKGGNRTSEVRHATTAGGVDTTSRYTNPAAGDARPHTLSSMTRSGGSGARLDEYRYDAAGNTITRKIGGNSQTLAWDPEGHLASVTAEGAGTTSFLYDADGNRMIRREPASTTLYLGAMELTLKSGSVQATRYYSFAGQTIAVRAGGTLRWLVGDHNGTAQLSVDPASLAVTRRRFLPFGEERSTVSWVGDKGFVGGTKDPTTGLTHLGAREYDPVTGRFLSVDPMMDKATPQQLHGYAYASNNPITFNDPTGLCNSDLSCAYEMYRKNPAAWDCSLDPRPCPKQSPGAPPPPKKPTGPDTRDVEEAKKTQKKSKAQVFFEAAGDVVKELIQYDDIRDCIGNLSLGSCFSVLVNIIPWTKIFKLKKIWNAVERGINAIQEFGRKLDWAKGVLKRADEFADAMRKYEDDFADWTERMKRFEENVAKVDNALEKADAAATTAAAVSSCLGNSFTADTRVVLADGSTKPIGEVKLGDVVLATDPESGRTAARKVTRLIVGEGYKDLVDVTLDAGDGQVSTVTATDGHPFWVADLSQWVDAGDLAVGAMLRTSAGTYVQVSAVHAYTQPQRVHNLTVEDLHTYYVLAGNTPVLVHNNSASCPIHSITGNPYGDPDRCTCPKGGAGGKGGAGRNVEESQTADRNIEFKTMDGYRREREKLSSAAVEKVTKVIKGKSQPGHETTDAVTGAAIGVGVVWAGIRDWRKRRKGRG